MQTHRRIPKILFGALLCVCGGNNHALAQNRAAGGDPLDQLPQSELSATPKISVELPAAHDTTVQADQRTTPHHFDIVGVRAIPFADVQREFAPFVDKEVDLGSLTAAAAHITQLYKDADYIMSFCFIPQQSFEDGRVRVEVVEGYIDQVKIEGNVGHSESRIREIAETLRGDRPLSAKTFARVTALLARVPGVEITAKVTPPTSTDGAAELVLGVNRHPIAFNTALDTYRPGTRVIATVTANSLTPLGDQLSVSDLLSRDSDDEQFYSVSESIPVGSEGLLLTASAYHYGSKETFVLPNEAVVLDRQRTDQVSLLASEPLVLKSSFQLVGSAGLELVHDDDRYSLPGTSIDQQANLRVLRIGFTTTLTLPAQAANGALNFYEGIPGLGESVSASEPVELRFTRLVFDAKDRINMFWNFETTVALRGQFSSDRLASSEQIAFGGAQFGQGYPISDIVGDHGVGASLEIGYVFKPATIFTRVEPYIAVDTAKAYDNRPGPSMPRIASAAIGTRFADGPHYSFDLNVARAIAAIPIDSDRRLPRLNLDFSYRMD